MKKTKTIITLAAEKARHTRARHRPQQLSIIYLIITTLLELKSTSLIIIIILILILSSRGGSKVVSLRFVSTCYTCATTAHLQ